MSCTCVTLCPEPGYILQSIALCLWVRGKHLSGGANSDVYEAVTPSTGARMAVKIVHHYTASDVKSELDNFSLLLLREIEIMSKLEHPNILHFLGCERGKNSIQIFLEYAEGGTLGSLH